MLTRIQLQIPYITYIVKEKEVITWLFFNYLFYSIFYF